MKTTNFKLTKSAKLWIGKVDQRERLEVLQRAEAIRSSLIRVSMINGNMIERAIVEKNK